MDEEYFIDDTSEETEIKDIDFGKDTDGSTLDLSETQYPNDSPIVAGSAAGASYGGRQSYPPQDIIAIPDNIVEKGARAAYTAYQDVWRPDKGTGTTSNLGTYRGNVGHPGHSVNEILKHAIGIQNGGFPWCASACYLWWTENGIESIPYNQNPAYVPNWVKWANSKGRWSKTPVVGALCVQGSPYSSHVYDHISIVYTVDKNTGAVTTVEPNYGDSCKYCTQANLHYNRSYNGVSVGMNTIKGYIIPG